MAQIDETSKSIQTFISALKRIAPLVNNREVSIRLARKCKEIVFRRVKSGKGVEALGRSPEETRQSQLAPLSSSYIKTRKGLTIFRTMPRGQVVAFEGKLGVKATGSSKGRGKSGKGAHTKIDFFGLSAPTLGEFGKPEKSNLTLSGSMLNDMIMSADQNGFILKIGNKKGPGRKKTNAEIADILEKGARWKNGNGNMVVLPPRPFFALTAGEVRIITRELENILREKLKTIQRLK